MPEPWDFFPRLILLKGALKMLIDVTNFTFAYEGSHDNIFENVSFRMDTDWRLGFTGRNGRGKTTFLRCLMGELDYSGSISAPGLVFEYFPVRTEDESLPTLQSLLTAAPEVEEWRLLRELAKLRIPDEALDRPLSTLSGGERTRCELAAMFCRDDAFPLIDEPTNHLDMAARELVGEYLARKRGFILVSHDRALLDACTDHTLSVNLTNIQVTRGPFSVWWENKRRQDEFEKAENEKLKTEIVRLNESARERAQWSDRAERAKYVSHTDKADVKHGWAPKQAAKAAKQQRRAKAITERRERAAEDKAKLLHNIERDEELKLSPLTHRAARVVEFRDVSIVFDGRTVLNGLAFDVRPGDRAALIGPNGSGKTSLLRLILGQDVPHTGLLRTASDLTISYVPQDTSGLAGSLAAYAERYGIDRSIFQSILRKLGFERVQFEKPLEAWSQGQKKKALLARSLCESAHLYIWDEPLNYVDVISRMRVEELLTAYKPTMLFVEHDRAFVDNIATKRILL